MKKSIILSILLLLAMAVFANGEAYWMDFQGDHAWESDNWTIDWSTPLDTAPTLSHNVRIYNGGMYGVAPVSTAVGNQAATVSIHGAGLTVAGGDLWAPNGTWVAPNAGESAFLDITGGDYESSVVWCSSAGTATFDISAGSFTVITQLMVADAASGSGTINMTGGLLTAPVMYLGHVGTGHVQLDGGVIDLGAFAAGAGGGTGTVDITGGALVLPGEITSQDLLDPIWSCLSAYDGTGSLVTTYDGVNDETTITAIPEPATLMLLGLGAIALIRKK